ncbi:6,7-dimethyl-8-ribityllumazine synthase [Cutibacterium sp. WCA-380-WT-3A]|uniref:6,7-dimethyl-8-ribityllumazine synthase n=1 Tax=Cutibacterium porci TaxID=2605781 RepID=A0A7K0J7S2_9ACTN|nr:6,7-dimethyl-8-ribityllumazine synthase [Cutibacterium porci]MSS46006.1 6,7-dimethyl-8-ribityllumazine synthase [Cutibacterium porci]
MSSRTTLGPAAPALTGLDGSGFTVAVIASQWHEAVMTGLLDGALRGLADCAVNDPVVVRVPGSFELPVACSILADHFDALVALGVVIRGGTPHFDYVCDAATRGITDVAVRTKTPIGFGVLTCDDDAQALDRAGLKGSHEDKGYEAAQAAIATLTAMSTVLASSPQQTQRA